MVTSDEAWSRSQGGLGGREGMAMEARTGRLPRLTVDIRITPVECARDVAISDSRNWGSSHSVSFG
jgi:hypothetical protein